MIRNLFFLVAIVAAASFVLAGCGVEGTGDTGGDNGLIIGGTDALEVTPEVGIYKTTITKGDSSETTFHLEAETPVKKDLVVYVTYNNGEGEFIVIRDGYHQSEAFDFMIDDTEVNTVTLQPDSERVKVSLPKLAKNTEKIEVTVDYNFKKYPYVVKENDASVSR